VSESGRPLVKIQILYTQKNLPPNARDLIDQLNQITEEADILKNEKIMDIPRKAILGVFYQVNDSLKRAFICRNNQDMLESHKPQECLAYTITPPDTCEDWEIPMQAERILSMLQATMLLEEVPPWTVKTFGLNDV
jgi:hypothetical protein